MIVFQDTTVPEAWNSVHQPIPWVFQFESKALFAVNDDGGFAQFQVVQYDYQPPIVGERIYVESGSYLGFHTITAASQGGGYMYFTTTTSYVATDSGMQVKAIVTIPEFSLYKGYRDGEGYEVELPFELVATFTPVVSPQVDIRFDVSGFLKSIFTIQPPTVNGVDFSLFNRFRILYDGHGSEVGGGFIFEATYQVLNSSIPTDELNTVYFGTGVYLSPSTTQIIFGCGQTILSLLDTTGVVINTDVDDGDTGADYFYNDYNDDDYLTQIST